MIKPPFFRRSGFLTFLGLAIFIGAYIVLLHNAAVTHFLPALILDSVLALATLLLTITLAAQFTFPVHDWVERLQAIKHLLNYLIGKRGPVAFVQSGKAIEVYPERKDKTSGIMLIDQGSAAVLRTDVRFSRSVGSGVCFTEEGERLAEPIDLRPQLRKIEGHVPPTDVPIKQEATTALALTQDGIPVSADLSIVFMLDPGYPYRPQKEWPPRFPPYIFNSEAAERAVYGHTYGDHDDIPWTELPLRLVIDLWREEVKRRSLESLFCHSKADPNPLQAIQQIILSHLSPSELQDGESNRPSTASGSREFRLLIERGIRMLSVQIENLYLPAEVQAERTRRWSEAWAINAHELLTQSEQQLQQARNLGEFDAYQSMAQDMTVTLRARLANGEKPDQQETLRFLLRDAVRHSSQEAIGTDSSIITAHLRSILEELEAGADKQGEARP